MVMRVPHELRLLRRHLLLDLSDRSHSSSLVLSGLVECSLVRTLDSQLHLPRVQLV